MLGIPPRLEFLILLVAGWVNRQQQDVIDYLKEENSVLRERLGGLLKSYHREAA